jgi:hypothetical protein
VSSSGETRTNDSCGQHGDDDDGDVIGQVHVLAVMFEFVVTAEKQKIEHADRLRAEYDEALQRMRQAPRDTVG